LVRTKPILLLAAFLFAASAHRTSAQSRSDLLTSVQETGSVPPIPQWFTCVSALSHHPYDKHKAQECLDSILSHPEITRGSFAFDKHGKALTFSVESPTLIVTDVDFGISTADVANFHGLLAINDAAHGKGLRIGEPYSHEREYQSWFVIDLFLRTQGRRSAISRTIRLDYEKKVAQVTYTIWEGPRGETDSLVPPFAKPCPILNGNFNGFDWDDFTPVQFIQRQMKTKWLGCYSEADLREDEQRIAEMPFLRESKIVVTGHGNERDFGFHFRSNPIPIGKVTVRGYGLKSGLGESDLPPLRVHAGDVYRSSLMAEQEDALKVFFTKTGWQINSFADVQVDSGGEAMLDFSILAFPDNIVYVNDRVYDVTRE
jgi:hypothetical protein